MSDLVAERIYDKAIILSILVKMWDNICEDGQESVNFIPDVDGEAWVLIHNNKDSIGLFNFHAHGACTLQVHAHVIPEFRKEHAINAGRAALNWFLETDYQKLIAYVPDIYPNVAAFCEKMGMKKEGDLTKSHLKNGKLCDQSIFGLTRADACQK